MKIENQVCTMTQGKRLLELGLPQGLSLFNWCCLMPDLLGENWYYEIVYYESEQKTLEELICPAFTVAELGQMLPCDYNAEKGRANSEWWAMHEDDEDGRFSGKATQAEVLADILILLLEDLEIPPIDCIKSL